MWTRLIDSVPRGYALDEREWRRRHRMLVWLLVLHVPGLAVFGLAVGHAPAVVAATLAVPTLSAIAGHLLSRHRRTASIAVSFGLVSCSTILVAFSSGTIEAHFHFFIVIGFIALYQDWAPFVLMVVFTVISHGIGSIWRQGLIFNNAAAQANPWLWSLIHGAAVLFACVGMTLFWRVTEESQQERDRMSKRLADAEIGRRQFTSDLLTNLARRNQSLLHRQLDIINQLEEAEQDPDALADLFALDHIATRVRRNAENLLVLSGEQPPRTWSEPVPLRDVVRAAIAETEDLTRVALAIDEDAALVGHAVTDVTHLVAELTENAVRFSAPDTTVTIRSRPDPRREHGWLLTVEDWGVGIPAEELTAANVLLSTPPEVDLSVSQRLGFHVVARLAARHGIHVALSATPGSGTTALVGLPGSLFASSSPLPRREPGAARQAAQSSLPEQRSATPAPGPDPALRVTGTAVPDTPAELFASAGPAEGAGISPASPPSRLPGPAIRTADTGASDTGASGTAASGAGASDTGSSGAQLFGAGRSDAQPFGAGASGAERSGTGASDAQLFGTGRSDTQPSDAQSSGAGPSGTRGSGAERSGAGASDTEPPAGRPSTALPPPSPGSAAESSPSPASPSQPSGSEPLPVRRFTIAPFRVEPFAPGPDAASPAAEPFTSGVPAADWQGWWRAPQDAAPGGPEPARASPPAAVPPGAPRRDPSPRPAAMPAITTVRTSPPPSGAAPVLPAPRAGGAAPTTVSSGARPSASPRPRPATAGSGASSGSGADGGPATVGGLRRRVPQAHLAESLRHPGSPTPAPDRPRDPAAARDAAQALSRYQANRARAVADGNAP